MVYRFSCSRTHKPLWLVYIPKLKRMDVCILFSLFFYLISGIELKHKHFYIFLHLFTLSQSKILYKIIKNRCTVTFIIQIISENIKFQIIEMTDNLNLLNLNISKMKFFNEKGSANVNTKFFFFNLCQEETDNRT